MAHLCVQAQLDKSQKELTESRRASEGSDKEHNQAVEEAKKYVEAISIKSII